MPGPILTAKKAREKYPKYRKELKGKSGLVYHRGNGVFSKYSPSADKYIHASEGGKLLDRKKWTGEGPYRHCGDTRQPDKSIPTSGYQYAYMRDKKKKGHHKPVHVRANRPWAKKPRRSHFRKKPWRKSE